MVLKSTTKPQTRNVWSVFSDGVYIIYQCDVFVLETEGAEVPSELFNLLIYQPKIKTSAATIEKI